MIIDKNKSYKLALFGDPVSHSLSPDIHRQFAQQFNIDIDYQLIQTNKENLKASITSFFNSGATGANITLPHKQDVLSMLAEISDIAKLSNAVNTLYLNNNSEICGRNTDGIGFINDLQNRCHFNPKSKNVLILGAGGASQGILPALMNQLPHFVYVANRTLEKAEKICGYESCHAISLNQLKDLDIKFDLIIHASSLGHQGKTLEFNPRNSNENTLAYDLSYGKAALPFLGLCKEFGIKNRKDGIGMLIEQAAYAFEIWFGVKPKTENIEL